MYAHILVPIDGSVCSDAAVAHALAIARAMGSTVVFLFVMDTLSARQEGVVNVQEARVALTAHGRPILDGAEKAALDAGVRAEGELVEGVPADVIAEGGTDFDLVVMGSHGKSLWKRLTVGSVTRAVLHRLSSSAGRPNGGGECANRVTPVVTVGWSIAARRDPARGLVGSAPLGTGHETDRVLVRTSGRPR